MFYYGSLFSYYYFFHLSLLSPCSLYVTLYGFSTFFVFRTISRFHHSDSLNFHSPFTSFQIKHQNVRYSLPQWPVTVPFAFVLSALSISGRSVFYVISCTRFLLVSTIDFIVHCLYITYIQRYITLGMCIDIHKVRVFNYTDVYWKITLKGADIFTIIFF